MNSIVLLLEDIGPVSSELRKEIMGETDDDTLKKWLRIAARAKSIDEFVKVYFCVIVNVFWCGGEVISA